MNHSNKYVPQEYFSVIYKATGKKKCDCGWEMDAINMVAKNPKELTYIRSTNHLMGQVIDVTPPPALPNNEIVVNMDGGVGGSWMEVPEEEFDKMFPSPDIKQLNQSTAEVFNP